VNLPTDIALEFLATLDEESIAEFELGAMDELFGLELDAPCKQRTLNK
jgi:hypothetical protein